jgi:hypothetical protein
MPFLFEFFIFLEHLVPVWFSDFLNVLLMRDGMKHFKGRSADEPTVKN